MQITENYPATMKDLRHRQFCWSSFAANGERLRWNSVIDLADLLSSIVAFAEQRWTATNANRIRGSRKLPREWCLRFDSLGIACELGFAADGAGN